MMLRDLYTIRNRLLDHQATSGLPDYRSYIRAIDSLVTGTPHAFHAEQIWKQRLDAEQDADPVLDT